MKFRVYEYRGYYYPQYKRFLFWNFYDAGPYDYYRHLDAKGFSTKKEAEEFIEAMKLDYLKSKSKPKIHEVKE